MRAGRIWVQVPHWANFRVSRAFVLVPTPDNSFWTIRRELPFKTDRVLSASTILWQPSHSHLSPALSLSVVFTALKTASSDVKVYEVPSVLIFSTSKDRSTNASYFVCITAVSAGRPRELSRVPSKTQEVSGTC